MENSKIKVLAIDDNQDNLTTLKALIKDAFPEAITLTALNGASGIELAAREDPDVILLDIVMPGMDGFEVCLKLKTNSLLRDIPIIFITAIKGDKESRIRALECGAEAFIAKPIDESELTAQIRSMLKIKTANNYKRDENVRLAALVAERTKELEESNDLIRIAGKIAKFGGWNVDLKKNLSYWSDEIATIHEMPPGFVPTVEKGISFYAPEWRDRIIKVFKDCAQNGIPYDEEMEIFTKSGKRVWVRTIGEAVKDNNGKIVKVQGAFQDISERFQAQHELIKAKEKAEENNRLKTAFLANLSHEVRTPLNSILGFAELLNEPYISQEEIKEYASFIDKGGKRMLNIINDLIDISKIESGLVEIFHSKFNLNEQIDDIYGFFKQEAEQKKIKISLIKGLPDNESVIHSDKDKVNAVLINLVKNALKFSHEGIIEIRYGKKEDFLEFCVTDNGIGIQPEYHKLIFERFRQANETITRNYDGSGLGLSISKAYIELLNGKIWVESEFGKGSKFCFTIPYN